MLNRKILKTMHLSLLVIFLFTTNLSAQKGELLWSYKIPGSNIDASVGIGDVDRDGYLDIVVGGSNGEVVALDGYGREIWKTLLKERITIAPTLMNVTGDAGLEVLVITQSGKISCLDGLTGSLIWDNTELGEIKWGSMNIVATDINNNGKNEIIVGDLSGKLVCLNGKGKKLWEYIEPEGIGSAPAIGDIDGDGKAEIIIASEDSPIICLDHKGKVKWRFKPEGDILESGRKREVAAPVIWDIDGDGKSEIITGMGFELVMVDNNGKKVWSFPMKNRIDSAISIADADEDGSFEIYAIDLSGNMVSMTKDGHEKWSTSLGFKARRSPTIADVDGDGIVEILAVGYGSKILVFEPNGKIKEELLIKGGSNASATIADLLGDGKLCAVVPEVSGNIMVYHWKSKDTNTKILWPEYRAWPSRTAAELVQNNRKKSKANKLVDKNAYDVGEQNLIDNLSELNKTNDELTNLIPQLPDSNGLLERVFYLSSTVKLMQNQVKNLNKLTPIKKRELRDNLVKTNAEFFKLSKIVKQAIKENNVMVAYAANPWAPFGGMDEIVEGRTSDINNTVEAFQGEFESAAINFFNFSGKTRTFRVEFNEFIGPSGATDISSEDVFVLRETVEVATQDADLSADALPELNSGSLLVIPAWDGRQLWLTINTKDLSPGTWKVKIKLKSLEIHPVSVETELSIKIWDVPLPKEQALNLCHWGITTKPYDALEDQIAHGTNIFPRTVPAKADFDATGNLSNIDFTDHDIFMKSHASHGMVLFHNPITLKGDSPAFSPAWEKAFRNFIPIWLKHLKELGFGYKDFAFYPVDEPGLEHGKSVARFMQWAKLIRDTDPKLVIYTNPVAHITMEQLQEMEPYVDIWTVLQTNTYPKEKLDFIHSTNAILWNYDPSDNAKHLSPLGYYRGQAWMSWHNGHTGIGFWTYSQGTSYWYQPDPGNDYAMIYEGNGVVTSKRWEAVRDGVEDFSLLDALKTAADAADKTGNHKELVEKAREILVEKSGVITEYMANNQPHRAGLDAARKIADDRWNTFRETSKEIAELLSKIKK